MDISSLPKIELHCHLDGLITPQMARAIRADDPAYPIGPEDVEKAYPIHDMESFFDNWRKANAPIDGQLKYYYPIIGKYIEQLKIENVHYFELMIALGEIPRDPVEGVDAIRAYREFVNKQEDGQIQVEFLVGIGRNRPLEQWPEREARVMALHDAGLIVGVGLAGIEPGYPVKPLQKSFARLHEAGLGIEIHAGEWAGPESVWDALEHGYPDRIGHGVALFEDARLIEIFQQRQIHIEMCPTSNVVTGSVARIEDHPIQKARDFGLNFSINTDDAGPFQCSMNSEYALVADLFGFDEGDFASIYANALAARFQPDLRIGRFNNP